MTKDITNREIQFTYAESEFTNVSAALDDIERLVRYAKEDLSMLNRRLLLLDEKETH